MKKTLLNNAGYGGFENVKFPVEVECEYDKFYQAYEIYPSELRRISGFPHNRKLIFIPGIEIV